MILLGFLTAATGCVNDTIKVRNRDTVMPAGRASWQAVEPSEQKWLGLSWSGLSVDGEIVYAEGDDKQNVAVSDQVGLGGTTIPGPVRVESRSDVIDVTANVRTGLAVLDVFRLEPVFGLELATVDLEIDSGGAKASERVTAGGGVVGIRAGLQAHEMVELYGLASFGALADKNKGTLTSKLEVGARLLPIDHFGVFAGYRWARYRQSRAPDDSDAYLYFSGPILGAEVRF
jgi:hypothetical protein